MNKSSIALLGTLLFFCPLTANAQKWMKQSLRFAEEQTYRQIEQGRVKGKNNNPCTINNLGAIQYISPTDWRSGFFPGSLWYLYELTGDKQWLPLAQAYSTAIESAKNYTGNHDVGFMIGCSFGNGWRITKNPAYKEVIIEAARSLSTRYRNKAGVIQSWNVGKNDARGWTCPVIIDNMMNLELLFEASLLSGDPSFKAIAISHADKTLKNHFRPNGSCYHVIDYDPLSGEVRHKHTHQGFSHESTWSRGHAWAIYGFTLCYRYTKNPAYLQQAIKTFEYMKDHPNMPKDQIPYWDLDAINIPNEPRDVSSATIIASALYEMSHYVEQKEGKQYRRYADKILQVLSTDRYQAPLGKNGNFILMHSVGSAPHNAEVDKPLNYADYYLLEALKRKKTGKIN